MENSANFIYATKNGVKLDFRSHYRELKNNRGRVIGLDRETIYTGVMLINGMELISPSDIADDTEVFCFERDIKTLAESIGAYNEVNHLIECAKKSRADLIKKSEG